MTRSLDKRYTGAADRSGCRPHSHFAGEEFSLRAVCDTVGVKIPTLYHFFGSKQGLIDAVVERGFDLYLGEKSSTESSGDPN